MDDAPVMTWPRPEDDPDNMFDDLRDRFLGFEPAPRAAGASVVWGGMMEMGMPKGTASLVCSRTGDTSMSCGP